MQWPVPSLEARLNFLLHSKRQRSSVGEDPYLQAPCHGQLCLSSRVSLGLHFTQRKMYMIFFFLESVYFKVGFFTFCLLGSFHPTVGKRAPDVVRASLTFVSFRIILLYLIWKFLWGNFHTSPEILHDEKAPVPDAGFAQLSPQQLLCGGGSHVCFC